jgi:hypothetical protein
MRPAPLAILALLAAASPTLAEPKHGRQLTGGDDFVWLSSLFPIRDWVSYARDEHVRLRADLWHLSPRADATCGNVTVEHEAPRELTPPGLVELHCVHLAPFAAIAPSRCRDLLPASHPPLRYHAEFGVTLIALSAPQALP